MERDIEKCSFSIWAVVSVLTVFGIGFNIPPVLAKQKTTQVRSEVVIGGLTVAEQKTRSFRLHEKLKKIIPLGVENELISIGIDQQDKDDLSVIPASGTAPLRVGVVKNVPGNIGKAAKQSFNFGVVQSNPDGSFVWAMEVKSPGALAIRLHLTDFSLPDNTEMYFLGSSYQAYGPYTGKGRNNSGEFWTRSIASDMGTIIISYTGTTPDLDQPKMSFTISDVGHIRGRPPQSQEKNTDTWPCSDNVDCLVDATCSDVGPAESAKNAIAKMEWIQSPYIYTCTGGLLADTDPNTQIPYFLTANHCLSSSNTTLETFFNYTTTSCEGFCPDTLWSDGTPPIANTIGATVVATGAKGDFTLLTLDEKPPAGAIFLGWNNSLIASVDSTPLYRISNPNFGPQAYSEHNIDATSPTCTGWPRGERIYSKDQLGATMGGSSGSPVLNSNGEVVGQLSGCCGYNCANECDSVSNWTVDGAFSYYWEQVADLLDPNLCYSNSDCDDGLFCNGQETCNNGVCQNGTPPQCNDDGLFCNGREYCDEDLDQCMTTENPCADGGCNETYDICLPSCGNGSCDEGENCDNCLIDCEGGTVGGNDVTDCFKGIADGVCHPKKDGANCPDCAATYCCGNGICEEAENSISCAIDCASAPVCGNGICEEGEDSSNCPEDCGSTPDCGAKKDPCNLNSDCCSNRCSNKGFCL